ncbi:MAG: ComEC/Rec2 family competence protein [Acutalibacteraceae bacterium]
MKRFFATVGFSFVFSLLLLNLILSEYAVYYALAAACLFALSMLIKPLRKRKEIPCIFLSFLLSALSFIAVTELSYKPQMKIAGSECEITATVTDNPTLSSSGNYSYPIITKTVNGEEIKIRMRLYTPYDICSEPYDEIEFSSKPFVLGDNNEMTYRYFRAKRTYLGAYTKNEVLLFEPEKKPFISFFFIRKAKSEENIRNYLDGDFAEFAISLLLGDKTYLSPEMKEDFSFSGLSHIMAVSGLHLSVWVMGLFLILRKLRFDKRVAGTLCILSSVCLVFFCAFSVSVIRAAVMMTVYFSAPFFARKGDSLNSLGFAAFIICALNPFAVCDISFLLSFFATLGILVFSDLFPFFFKRNTENKPLYKIGRYAVGTAAVSLSAGIFTVPIIIRYFSSLTVWGVLGNVAVAFAVAPCLLLAGALSVCPDITFIAYPVKTLLMLTEKYIFYVVGKIDSLKIGAIISDSLCFRLIFPLFIISAVFVLYCVKKKKLSPTALLTALSMIIVTVS